MLYNLCIVITSKRIPPNSKQKSRGPARSVLLMAWASAGLRGLRTDIVYIVTLKRQENDHNDINTV